MNETKFMTTQPLFVMTQPLCQRDKPQFSERQPATMPPWPTTSSSRPTRAPSRSSSTPTARRRPSPTFEATSTIFHRVIAGFMAQGGGYDDAYQKKAVQAPVENEAHNGLKNLRGTVAMARTSDPHSATAQFFVSLADNAFLDHKGKTERDWGYTVFGKVTAGMDVVERIGAVRTGAQGPFAKDAPLEPVVITSARRG